MPGPISKTPVLSGRTGWFIPSTIKQLPSFTITRYCFSPTAIFVDYCPKDAGQPQLHAYGPEGIDMFFRNRFLFRRFEITDPLIVSDTQAYYYAVYNGYHIRAVATIQDFSEDGEIQRLVVRPA